MFFALILTYFLFARHNATSVNIEPRSAKRVMRIGAACGKYVIEVVVPKSVVDEEITAPPTANKMKNVSETTIPKIEQIFVTRVTILFFIMASTIDKIMIIPTSTRVIIMNTYEALYHPILSSPDFNIFVKLSRFIDS